MTNAAAGVDLAPLYPDQIRPQFISDLRAWYITTYSDQFFVKPPSWFTLYMWLELVYHVPVSIWAIGALLRGKNDGNGCYETDSCSDDPKVPLHLLVFALETAVTTATCVADYLSWTGYTTAQKIEIGKLYVPYLILGKSLNDGDLQTLNVTTAVFMTIDMYSRLNKALGRQQAKTGTKKMQ